jgi:hypothetical protein
MATLTPVWGYHGTVISSASQVSREGQILKYRQIRKNGRLHVPYTVLVTQGLLLPSMTWDWEDPCTSMHCSQVGIQSGTGKDHRDRG